jgi:hypothetical protein
VCVCVCAYIKHIYTIMNIYVCVCVYYTHLHTQSEKRNVWSSQIKLFETVEILDFVFTSTITRTKHICSTIATRTLRLNSESFFLALSGTVCP